MGAVNTVLLQPGGLTVGSNTDVHGLVRALREAEPVPAPAGGVSSGVIIGGGATAASAMAALGELGVRRPVVAVRSLGRAGSCCEPLRPWGWSPSSSRSAPIGPPGLLRGAEIVVSTVPGGASAALAPLVADVTLDRRQVLLDVVYEGWPTPFPMQWLASGGSVAPGYLMLLHQACEQVRLMTGVPAPEAAMRAALLAAVEHRMSPAAAVAAGVVAAGVAALLAPWTQRLAARESRWTSRPALLVLGAVAGTGAALVADGLVELVAFVAFALGCSLLVALDLACHRLPDIVTVPTAAVLVVGLLLASVETGSWSGLGRALLAGLILGAVFLVLALISPRSLGLGDVKLAALLGLFLGWFGWPAVAVGVIATFLLGGLTALLLVLSRRATRSTELAFGTVARPGCRRLHRSDDHNLNAVTASAPAHVRMAACCVG